ncbi:hypothetical protein [Bosea sp. (in: a-proteobacteria)]|uniref:hypothetical protein n=1 Tax=Bosea sp. (in: a-proteobacteria) TaxID=1871050 RepID=UPI0026046B1A|nr:hypothetical protein [Bosea sp. (in: a-proteobacteria)]MCO5091157.1 hypothetical protein [Bosea sp. (in: a-proteobacteria)]
MKKTALILCGLVLAPATALAGPTCSPSHDDARVLSGPSADSPHKDWQEGKSFGFGWSLQVGRNAKDKDGTGYYVGDLYDPTGKLATRNVFVIEQEWDCGP